MGLRGALRSRISTPAIALVTTVALAAATGSCSPDDGDRASPAADIEGDPVAGEQVYDDYCGACHGRDFEGSVQGPSQLDAHFDPSKTTDADYRDAIRNGTPESAYDFGDMPAIRSLDDRQIADVIAYIRSVQAERGIAQG